MSDLTTMQNNLPDTLEDLSKFVLVGREKLTAVRANIRAIDKLQLAEDVREQKKEEAQMLAEALMDAEVRIGDLLKTIPKAKNQYATDSGVHSTKKEVITNLGFNEKQAQRFETMASNKDVVEQVKAEARENEDMPTRTRVLQLVKAKNEQDETQRRLNKEMELERAKIEKERKIQQYFMKTISDAMILTIDDEHIEAWFSDMNMEEIQEELTDVDKAISNLKELKNEAETYLSKNKLKVVK